MPYEFMVWMREGKYQLRALVNRLTKTLFPQVVKNLQTC